MNKKKAFWTMWVTATLFIIWFFFVIGELKQMDLGKSIILTIVLLLVAIPIYFWIKDHHDFE
ncbi:hypothetical protein [Thalassotalea profundi]|uniref:Uncharacterized protein n=1 Tax=Thalassotalea profundi TaxID=2036687 RepID=A0ABQ3IJH3_9GAMM|nr:hypothetical protein [Thalassotalea profundi]GHE83637.1 hypothetical protein GCM10011501_10280 [Thalassotalea profundi]